MYLSCGYDIKDHSNIVVQESTDTYDDNWLWSLDKYMLYIHLTT